MCINLRMHCSQFFYMLSINNISFAVSITCQYSIEWIGVHYRWQIYVYLLVTKKNILIVLLWPALFSVFHIYDDTRICIIHLPSFSVITQSNIYIYYTYDITKWKYHLWSEEISDRKMCYVYPNLCQNNLNNYFFSRFFISIFSWLFLVQATTARNTKYNPMWYWCILNHLIFYVS